MEQDIYSKFAIESKIYVFCFILFSFLSFSLCAQQSTIDIDENAQNRIMAAEVQPCDYDINLNLNYSSIINNTKQIPAYGLYQNLWDTLYIRSEVIEIPFFDNQLKVILVQGGNTPFAFPTSGDVSMGYVKNKGKQHAGVDFSVQKREPVVACFDGVVRVAKKYNEYGNTVIIRHYNGLETLYALLDDVCMITGQTVKAGDLIGHISSRKNALHFETRFLNEFFNPYKIINFEERRLQSNMLTLTPNDFMGVPPPPQKPTPKTVETKPESKEPVQDTPKTTQQDTPKTTQQFHTVGSGETIFKICSKYNITEQQLRSLNNIKGDHIEIGQKLRVK